MNLTTNSNVNQKEENVLSRQVRRQQARKFAKKVRQLEKRAGIKRK